MRENVSSLILAVGCFMIIIGGCANNEVVKSGNRACTLETTLI